MNTYRFILRRLYFIVASERFFWGIVGLLIVQALWIALTGRYPLAFDEDFHVGLIKLYADHPSPFWSSHPAGGDAFGALTRDPSYLFHWVFGFIYRFIAVFTDNQTLQILIMRLINIGLFASCLPLFRRLLLKTRASQVTVHTVLLLFVLVPIVPLLAAHVNYDNAIMPLTALSLLLAISLVKSFKLDSFNIRVAMQLLSVGIISSLVKYAYLPVFVGIVVFVLFKFWQTYRVPTRMYMACIHSWKALSAMSKWALTVALLISSILFLERYAVNLVKYHTPVPDCAQVLSYNECKSYGPWIRDYDFEQTKLPNADKNPIYYTQTWFRSMWVRSFFAVDGPTTSYQTRGPLTLPGLGAVVMASIGALAFVLSARQIWRKYDTTTLSIFVSALAVYIPILWLTEYQLFVQTSVPVAINGRYLLLLLPCIMLFAALGLRELLRKQNIVVAMIAVFAIGCFAWGGGALTYVLRSNDSWYWPGTPLKNANHAVQDIVGPVTPGYKNPTQYLR